MSCNEHDWREMCLLPKQKGTWRTPIAITGPEHLSIPTQQVVPEMPMMQHARQSAALCNWAGIFSRAFQSHACSLFTSISLLEACRLAECSAIIHC